MAKMAKGASSKAKHSSGDLGARIAKPKNPATLKTANMSSGAGGPSSSAGCMGKNGR